MANHYRLLCCGYCYREAFRNTLDGPHGRTYTKPPRWLIVRRATTLGVQLFGLACSKRCAVMMATRFDNLDTRA
mgnify:CR=1 FL=1